MKLKFKTLIFLLFFLFVSCGIPGGIPNPTPPPVTDIDINVCLDNPQQTRARADCPDTELRSFPKETVLVSCVLDHAPQPEYVKRNVCMVSGELEHTYCPTDQIEYGKEFVKGTEPVTWCSVHKVPIVYPEAIEDIHADFLGIHLWWLWEAWDADNFEEVREALGETLHNTRIRGIGTLSCFVFVGDGEAEHAHLNNKTPYLYLGNGRYDLSRWESRFWELFEEFAKACAEYDIRWAPSLFMDRYDYGPFENNINGVHDFWSLEAFEFQKSYAQKVCGILSKYSDDYWIKPINEAAHYGNRDQFHVIGRWHEKMWHEVFQHFIRIDRLIVDVSLSEGAQIYLNEILPCGKPYIEGEKHGDPDHDRVDVTNSILAETHGVVTKEDLIGSEKLNFLYSKWRRYKHSGDGGETGSFFLSNTGFRQGNVTETYDLGIYYWTLCKRRDRQGIIGIFTMEAFRDKDGSWLLWIENYRSYNIFWERIDSLVLAWETIYR